MSKKMKRYIRKGILSLCIGAAFLRVLGGSIELRQKLTCGDT